jgi:argininosuccinate lyase
MLPQKKNPDIAELARGKAGRLIGHLSGFLATLKGLPLSYNRDLQEDKEPLFDSLIQVGRALLAVNGMLSTALFDFARMKKAADSPYLCAIDLAEFLVKKGIPFRKAHSIVGGLVRDSLERHVPLEELVSAHPSLGDEAAVLLLPGESVKRRITRGGSGTEAVALQRSIFAERLTIDAKRLDELSHLNMREL